MLGDLFVQHHEEVPDPEFVRIFRILRDFGYEFDGENPEHLPLIKRFEPFQYTEPK
jgi:hypothetical protein